MPTITKSFVYLSDAEGLVDGANHAGIAFAFEGSDGSPANGCLKFTTVQNSLSQAKEYARRSSTGQTWETWGVPPGAEVTLVRITGWRQKVTGEAGLDNFTIKARIIDGSGVSVHSAGDLLNSDGVPWVLGSWETKSAGALRTVDFLSQESTQDVRLEIEWLVTTQIAGTSVDVRFDSFDLAITYDDGSTSGGASVAIPIQNLDGLVFMKGFATASRAGSGLNDAVGMAALQECSITHGFEFAEARGPESLQPLGVGVVGENLSGSIRHLVLNAEQLVVFLGGSATYAAGTNKTTYTKLTDQEPNPFDLRLKTPEDGSDLEVIVYNALASNMPIVEGGANREFKVFGLDWRAYGQNTAQGKKLFQVILPGNQTSAS